MIENKVNKWNTDKLFWGLLLIMIGSLVLASNFGLVKINFANIFRLWPLFIVMAGLSILSFQHIAWRISMVVLAILAVLSIAWVLVGDVPSLSPLRVYTATVKKSSNNIKQLNVSIKSGAGSLDIDSAKQASAAKVRLESNIVKMSEQSNSNGIIQYLSLDQKTKDNYNWLRGDVRNIWNVSLNPELMTNLSVDVGASSIKIDMTNARLQSLNVKTGASDLSLKIGRREPFVSIDIDSGVSSLVIKIPKESGVSLGAENGLTSNSLADLVKVSENAYESANYKDSRSKVSINSKVGLSYFLIERY